MGETIMEYTDEQFQALKRGEIDENLNPIAKPMEYTDEQFQALKRGEIDENLNPVDPIKVGINQTLNNFIDRTKATAKSSKPAAQIRPKIADNTPVEIAKLDSDFNAKNLPEIGSAPELNELSTQSFVNSLKGMVIRDEKELAVSLAKTIPDSKVRVDKEGNYILTTPSGSYAINKPGFSGKDVLNVTTGILEFLPVGRAVSVAAKTGASVGKRAGMAAAGAGATETAHQGLEVGLGGEFNPQDVAIATGTGGIGEGVLGKIGEVASSRSTRQFMGEVKDKMLDKISTLSKARVGADDIPITQVAGKEFNANQLIEKISTLDQFDPTMHPNAAKVLNEIADVPLDTSEVYRLSTKIDLAMTKTKDPVERKMLSTLNDVMKTDWLNNGTIILKDAKTRHNLYQQMYDNAKRNVDDGFAKSANDSLALESKNIIKQLDSMNIAIPKQERAMLNSLASGNIDSTVINKIGGGAVGAAFGMSMLSGLSQTLGVPVEALAAISGYAGSTMAKDFPISKIVPNILKNQPITVSKKLTDMVVNTDDGDKIVRAYLSSVPKNERKAGELAGLLLGKTFKAEYGKKRLDQITKDAINQANMMTEALRYSAPVGVAEPAAQEFATQAWDDTVQWLNRE